MMRSLIYTAPGKVEIGEQARMLPARGEVEIAVEVAGICGSDISGFLGHSPRRQPPLVLGHEVVGQSSDGRRVVVNPLVSCGHCRSCQSGCQNHCATWTLLGMDRTPGAFAEYVSVPTTQVYALPDALPSARAVLTEPLANIVHLFRIASPPPSFRLAIVGGGAMGALALLRAGQIGAHDVLVVDVNEERLKTMAALGASTTANAGTPEGIALASEIAGWGFDVVLDASGSGAARQMAFDLCRPGGQVILLGMASLRSELDFVKSIRKEHRVVTSFAYTPGDFEEALSLLVAGRVDLSPYTVTMPLARGQEAFDLITNAPGSTLKMLLSVSGRSV